MSAAVRSTSTGVILGAEAEAEAEIVSVEAEAISGNILPHGTLHILQPPQREVVSITNVANVTKVGLHAIAKRKVESL